MTDYRKTFGLPERYFLSLGRMVEKKNLSTLVEAYAQFARASVEKHGAGSVEHGATAADRYVPALVFVGSGELEGALREQARGLGLKVIDRTEWRAGQSSHGLTRINADGSARLAADRTEGIADSRVTPAVGGLSAETTDGGDAAATAAANCKLQTEHSVENDRGAVFFYGFRQIEENTVFYALAEAFVLPSLYEEWGLVVNEAMAAGLPVIVSRTAGCAEDLVPEATASRSSQCSVGSKQPSVSAPNENTLEERFNGFAFDPTSADALATALRRIGESEQLCHEMGKKSREIVARFSCGNFARQALRAAEAAQQA